MASKPQSQSPPPGVKKPRKKPRSRQVISQETWEAIEKAVCAGMGFSEAARVFGVLSPHTIIMRSRAQHWPVPSRVQERARLLQESLQSRSEAAQEARFCNDQALEAAAQSWAEKGEAHRGLVYDLTNAALRKVAKAPPPLESWSDIERADKAARRACGLEDSEATRNINVGMQLINQRLEIITAELPKDFDW